MIPDPRGDVVGGQHADVHWLVVVRLQIPASEFHHFGVHGLEFAVLFRNFLQRGPEFFVQLRLCHPPAEVECVVLALEGGDEERGEHVVAVEDRVRAIFSRVPQHRQRRAREVHQGDGAGFVERVHSPPAEC
jgi:hypothetical protein